VGGREEKAAFDAALRDHQSGNLAAAIAAYRAILDRDPDIADAWHLLGVALHQTGKSTPARRMIETAIALNDGVADYHNNLGMILVALGERDAAEQTLRHAVRLQPAGGKALANLAGLLRARGALDEAFELSARAVALAPGDAEAHNNLGNVLKDVMRIEEALDAYERAIALRGDFALAHWNRALALLSLGRYPEGFAELAWRWRWSGFPSKPRTYPAPLWDGGDLAGKTLFLYPEQGLGDVIQFVRYAALARAQGARVIVEAPADLVPLIARARIVDVVTATAATAHGFDYHAPLLDLPHHFATTLETVPAPRAYLAADPARVETLRAGTRGSGGLRVGLNWSGNPNSPVERFRAPPLDRLRPFADLDGVDWICLQRGPGGDLLPRPAGLAVIETGEGSLDDTAALIAGLDLVVSTDTAVAHLAGALGVPTFLLLHQAPDWRWLPGRPDDKDRSPWYPSMRLFRQEKPGDWGPVIGSVADAVDKMRTERV
jgi:Flp pilus assembly protein TadD